MVLVNNKVDYKYKYSLKLNSINGFGTKRAYFVNKHAYLLITLSVLRGFWSVFTIWNHYQTGISG